jgi:ELWxxDGT repeat protein
MTYTAPKPGRLDKSVMRRTAFLLLAPVLIAGLTANAGVAASTNVRLVKDINVGSSNALRAGFQPPSFLTAVRSTLFFVAKDGVNGWELWKTDGTRAGTMLVTDIIVDTTNVWRGLEMAEAGGILFFSADDGVHGLELWKAR